MRNRTVRGDFAEVARKLPDQSVDVIFTDPPYAREHQHLYTLLAEQAARLLKDGGSLVSIIPHYNLPFVLTEMNHAGLKWRWPYTQTQEEGSHPRMAMGIEVCYKLFGHWVKRAYPSGRGFLRDSVPAFQHKLNHEWEQDIAPAMYYIERLCPPGGVVLDPFCGSGTYLLAAKRLKRNFIGVDIDRGAILITRERLRRFK